MVQTESKMLRFIMPFAFCGIPCTVTVRLCAALERALDILYLAHVTVPGLEI